ncbi:NAD(P)/FAD-dependent oxidoreductase [Mycobacterium koreense]|uniref:Cyclohexanone monooxygenase n=1 Tax=Mycolicibacillus koreensis TaxID=1069220 RepID=A0A7I7SKC5_9MYCO|nr:NAD(P)/FAD-dependent oxidoreductase [Mycolicibacillus koreensis]MCV7250529.1 NAD(P)/FAD-dependent oxidoreductase [Mycolicibacillus koreensis]OSC32774.1 cyclohexanone monooxygenase [Mycolicibacillus koreensis]BBY56396.1 cyclohexanone monooxygenase [Mycolicibacillus koreensis]
MTSDGTTAVGDVGSDPAEMRAMLREADAGVLVAVLAQLTGDATVADRFAPHITFVPDPPEVIGATDEDTMSALVDAVAEAMTAERPDSAVPHDDPALFARIAPLALGTEVSEEYIGLLLEQGGFHPFQPVLPRTAELPPDFKVVVVGAGIAGLAAALELADAGIDFEIIDRNSEVGGTWYTTKYPGIGVDTPSAYYSLSRDINGDWSSYYPYGGEYQDYLVSVCDKNGLRDHIRFDTEVEAMWWDDERRHWRVRTVDTDGVHEEIHANVVIPAAGYLNRPRWPELAGRETFAGISVHSAQWDPALDLSGKRVAIIGAGCTAVQIVDACVDEVEHLTVFQRQPHWVAPRKRLTDDVPEHKRWLNNHVPFYANWTRLKSFWGTADNNFPVIIRDPQWAAENPLSISPANDVLLRICQDYIARTFGADSELAAKVTPDFAPYGKRIIRDPGGYYAALTRPHVDVENAEPASVNERGIVTGDGRQIDLDVIIYATGYHLDFLSTVDIRGRDGVELAAVWGGSPSAYRGGMVPGFPNMFISSAPNYSPGHGAGHNFGVEVMVHYVMECLQLMALRDASTIEVRPEAFSDYVAAIDEAMADTVWCHTPTAHTYYRSAGGRIVTAFPFRLIDVWRSHRAPVEEDLVIA